MDNFNYQAYLKNNPLLQEEVKEEKLLTESQEIDETVEDSVSEDARTDAEQEGYKDGFNDAKDDVKNTLSKMKVSELKSKIKETILAELSLAEAEEEVDVDVDVEDEVSVDAEGDDVNITKKSVKADIEVGLSPEEELVQDSLEAAMKASQELGNQTLTDQIGNKLLILQDNL